MSENAIHPRLERPTTRRRKPQAVTARLGTRWQTLADPGWLAGWHPIACEIAGGETEVVVFGEGETLVLMPPLPGFKEAWVACAADLARDHRVVTFDLRVAFGPGPRWPQLLDDTTRVLDALGANEVVLVGHSLGGALAQQWTLEHPKRVRAVVLSSSFARVHTPRGQWWSRWVAQPFVLMAQRTLPRGPALALARRWAAEGSWVYDARCDDHVLDLVRHCIRQTPVDMARAMVGLAFEHDTRSRLAGLTCPTLIVVGERESPFALEAAADLARLIPGSERRTSPQVSHLHPLSQPEWLATTIRAWLAATRP